MAGLQSGNKIWEDWLKTGYPKILQDLEIWMGKLKVTKPATKFEKIHLKANLNAKVNQNY